jgi:uncharacterized protein
VRIAIDIDSTLHHYWDVLERLAQERFGVLVPYAEQRTFDMPGLEREQVRKLIEESHRDEHVLAAVPYPGAVETVRAWHAAGHWIHVTSHRSAASRAATVRWLAAIGMPYDDLHCSDDKLTRARELGIELLIDDAPDNLRGALESGMRAATLVHPWNEDLCEEGDVVCAPDWPALRARLEPILAAAA